ncbi:hypothetical protein [Rheinheimera maricola]|uniref:hypothetical protein n=1 Tax=Rheinheimera maricola TaxID=2793282 RepID=UPI001FD7758B|nr:hypothetical protein [Rheinheimera maricola]
MNFSVKAKLLISGGVIASAAAIWHLLCIWGGPGWFAFARAPGQIIDSAEQGTLLAPVGTVIVAALMFACTVFAFSAVGLIRKVPLVKPALITIAVLCTARGLIAIPTFVTAAGVDIWQIVASTVWLYVGICFIAGSVEYRNYLKSII